MLYYINHVLQLRGCTVWLNYDVLATCLVLCSSAFLSSNAEVELAARRFFKPSMIIEEKGSYS